VKEMLRKVHGNRQGEFQIETAYSCELADCSPSQLAVQATLYLSLQVLNTLKIMQRIQNKILN
jgi:hypothetical protein